MQNVDFYVDPQIPLHITRLSGTMMSRTRGPVMFDDKRSFVIRVTAAEAGLTGPALSTLLNKYVFNYPGSPITNLRVTVSGNEIIQKGTLHKVGALPFEIRASLSVTPDGRIRLHPTRTEIIGLHVDRLMNGLGLPLSKIIDTIRMSNRDVGGRIVELSETEYMVRGVGYLRGAQDLAKLTVRAEKGVPVRLSDVARIELAPDERRGIAELNGNGEVVGGIVVARYGTHVIDVIDNVKQRINEIATGLPEGVKIETHSLARFAPVLFDKGIAALIARTAQRLGHSCRPMTSGAGHDAQMLARICPTAMVFVPSVKGISHNPAEHTEPAHLAAGADVLLHTLLELTA